MKTAPLILAALLGASAKVTTSHRTAFKCQYGGSKSIDCYQNELLDISIDANAAQECAAMGMDLQKQAMAVEEKERNDQAIEDAAMAVAQLEAA